MLRNSAFDEYHDRYEKWFATHQAAYASELLAVRSLLPREGLGFEIGVGTGRFAAPLGVGIGIDPSPAMLRYAQGRRIQVVQGVAEQLPFAADSFDYGLIVTTICFVEDPLAMLREARRVIKPEGSLTVAFVDRESVLGQQYLACQAESLFYRRAMFFTTAEVEELLCNSGFPCQEWVQTLSAPLSEMKEIEPLRSGRGANAFVVVKGMGTKHDRYKELLKNKEMFQRIAEFSAEWLYWRGPEGKMHYVSPAASEISGYEVDELMSFPEMCEAIIHTEDRSLWREHVHQADTGGKPVPIEFRVVTKEGTVRWISHVCRPIYGKNVDFLGISGSNRDITARRQAEEQLNFLSTHDNLTGLFNRSYFNAEMERLAAGRQFPVSIVMADVDGLKQVNDRFGHAAGDVMLQQAAKVLTGAFRAEDVVARIGGDEFAVLLPGADNRMVTELLNRIATSQEAVNCSGPECPVSLSLGAATIRSGEKLSSALKLADKRMYQNKFTKKHR